MEKLLLKGFWQEIAFVYVPIRLSRFCRCLIFAVLVDFLRESVKPSESVFLILLLDMARGKFEFIENEYVDQFPVFTFSPRKCVISDVVFV